MRCAGTDYKFSTSSQLTYRGGKISGSWSETTYDASGTVSGTASGNSVRAIIRGDKFSGRLSLKVTAGGHSINILQLNEKTGTYSLATSLQFSR